MGEKRLVIDTNVIISGLGWKGNPRKALLRVITEDFSWIISRKQLEEFRQVLSYPKFDLDPTVQMQALQIVLEASETTKIEKEPDQVEDQGDNVILATAAENDCSWILSGDKELLNLGDYRDVDIVGPEKFLYEEEDNAST